MGVVHKIMEGIEETFQDEYDIDGDSESQWQCSRTRQQILEQDFNHIEDWMFYRCETAIEKLETR